MNADERLACIAALTAGLAHELRNVLAAADSSLFLATRLDHDPVARAEHVAAGRRHLHAAQDLVTRALAPAGSLSTEELTLAAWIDRSVTSARTPNVRIEIELPPGAGELAGDPLLLDRALVNLLENAAQAGARAGHPELSVRVVGHVTEETVQLDVVDDGPGLDALLLARLFQPLAKGHAAGTGLGLRLVRAVAELHGGSVTATSNPRGGATFSIRLPRSPPGDLAPGAEAPARDVRP